MFEMFYTFSQRMLAVCAILTGVIILLGIPLGGVPVELVLINFAGIWIDMFLLWVLKKFRNFVKEKCE
jgi:hypothetical protein